MKQQQRVVHTKSSCTSTPFELIHSDLCGPMKRSKGGSPYYIIYIDNCTRYTEVYFLVTKSAEQISVKFQNYQAWVENRRFRIKRFWCDNGSGEYNNSVFLGLLGGKGIVYEPAPLSRRTDRTSDHMSDNVSAYVSEPSRHRDHSMDHISKHMSPCRTTEVGERGVTEGFGSIMEGMRDRMRDRVRECGLA
jgi:hypothetical protein